MSDPFPMVEKAVKEIIERYEPADGKVGRDPNFDSDVDIYVMLDLVPGGSTTQLNGEWVLDIDVFSTTYNVAMGHALALEALLVRPRHVTTVIRLDNCYENLGPAERPWDDDGVYRVGATYVFTARRSG